MRPSVGNILRLSKQLKQNFNASDAVVSAPRVPLSQKQPAYYKSLVDNLDSASDYGSGTKAVKRASKVFDGADNNEIETLLSGIEKALVRIVKSNPVEGKAFNQSRVGLEDAVANARLQAERARTQSKQTVDVDKLATDLLERIKNEMPSLKDAVDIEGMAEAFAELAGTSVLKQLIKEGVDSALRAKGVSSLLTLFSKADNIQSIDSVMFPFSLSKLRALIGTDTKTLDMLRMKALEGRLRLMKRDYSRAGAKAKKGNVAQANADFQAVDNYGRAVLAAQLAAARKIDPSRVDKLKEAMDLARTNALGKLTASSVTTPPAAQSAAQSSRRRVGRPPDADPLAGPLGGPPPEPPPMPFGFGPPST